MRNGDFDALLQEFQRTLHECQQLFRSSAKLCIQQSPYLLPGSPEDFLLLMEDLHRGVLIKIYVTIVQADEKWTTEEKRLGQQLFQYLWGSMPEGSLRETAQRVFRDAEHLHWAALVRPFQQFPVLRDRAAPLETLIVRLANLIAKADGKLSAGEMSGVRRIQFEVESVLRDVDHGSLAGLATGTAASAQQHLALETLDVEEELTLAEPLEDDTDHRTSEERLAAALEKLDNLIGLPLVKNEIHTLINFLKLQQQRAAAGLPRTKLSLHLVFGGNPGTGKTTVARIVGEIYGAMGILKIGHLVETDRSGLVAEYVGQTGPKTNKKIDEALDGVLFIDEAYGLVDESGDDAYGREALQTLLKRMEDSRDRLVVILAGYPEKMQRLIRSNPGLSSRFNTQLQFEDYRPAELAHIFGGFCQANHYEVPAPTRVRALLGFSWLYEHRDEHFGNARLVRNTFETAIRRLANRIAGERQMTRELLTTIQPEDLVFPGVPLEVFEVDLDNLRFRVPCDGCGDVNLVPAAYLGRRVRCNRCQHRFTVDWGEPS